MAMNFRMTPSHPILTCPLEVHYMSRKEMEPLIRSTGASFTDVASQQTELYEGRETHCQPPGDEWR